MALVHAAQNQAPSVAETSAIGRSRAYFGYECQTQDHTSKGGELAEKPRFSAGLMIESSGALQLVAQALILSARREICGIQPALAVQSVDNL